MDITQQSLLLDKIASGIGAVVGVSIVTLIVLVWRQSLSIVTLRVEMRFVHEQLGRLTDAVREGFASIDRETSTAARRRGDPKGVALDDRHEVKGVASKAA